MELNETGIIIGSTVKEIFGDGPAPELRDDLNEPGVIEAANSLEVPRWAIKRADYIVVPEHACQDVMEVLDLKHEARDSDDFLLIRDGKVTLLDTQVVPQKVQSHTLFLCVKEEFGSTFHMHLCPVKCASDVTDASELIGLWHAYDRDSWEATKFIADPQSVLDVFQGHPVDGQDLCSMGPTFRFVDLERRLNCRDCNSALRFFTHGIMEDFQIGCNHFD